MRLRNTANFSISSPGSLMPISWLFKRRKCLLQIFSNILRLKFSRTVIEGCNWQDYLKSNIHFNKACQPSSVKAALFAPVSFIEDKTGELALAIFVNIFQYSKHGEKGLIWQCDYTTKPPKCFFLIFLQRSLTKNIPSSRVKFLTLMWRIARSRRST
jgi:hypothetical protein